MSGDQMHLPADEFYLYLPSGHQNLNWKQSRNFTELLRIFVELQKGWVWKAPLEVILPNPFCEAGLPIVMA